MGEWKKVRIGEFLTERQGRYKPNDNAIATYKRLDKIDFSGTAHISEKPSKTDMIVVQPGDLVISGINVAKGAIAVYQGTEPVTATIHYSSYIFDDSVIDLEYFKYFVKSPAFIETLKKQAKGGIKTEIKPKVFLPLEISLPDLPTQKQIVKRISVNLKRVNELAKEIEAQKLYVKQLRRNILQDAIEGKLTADRRKEHPVQKGNPDYDAEALFELIQKERQVDKKRKALPPILDAEKPFELPTGWKWVRLGEVCEIIGGYAFNSYDFKEVGDNYILRLGNIRNGKIRYDAKPAFVSDKIIAELSEYEAKLNDILITMTGTRGKQDYLYSVKITENYLKRYPMFVNQRVGMIRSKSNADFIYICLKSDMLKASIFESSTGSANQANIGIKALFSWNIPFPPLLEQKEIAQLIERMLLKVDQLEQQILRREEYINQLMKSVLKDIFKEDMSYGKTTAN